MKTLKNILWHIVGLAIGGAVFFMLFWSLCCDTLPWQAVPN